MSSRTSHRESRLNHQNERIVSERRYEVIVDCAGVGGAEAGSRRWRFSRFVTLSSPLLRLTDARGLVGGGCAAAAQLVADGLSAARSAPAPSSCPPHVRWAFFAPSSDDIETLRRLAERGRVGASYKSFECIPSCVCVS